MKKFKVKIKSKPTDSVGFFCPILGIYSVVFIASKYCFVERRHCYENI